MTELSPIETIESLLKMHEPKSDGPMSLLPHTYCGCGAYEPFRAGDGHMSIGPAKYPCQAAKALAVSLEHLKATEGTR
jgi:hypothetical protein